MPKRPPFLRGRTLCIFCEGASGASISHEHVLPDWLNEVFPRDPATVHTLGTTSWVGFISRGSSYEEVSQARARHNAAGACCMREVQ